MSYLYSKDKFASYLESSGEIGEVKIVSHPLIYLEGLPTVFPQEVVMFENGDLGQVLSVNPELVEVLTFSQNPPLIGTKVAKLGKTLEIPVGFELLGKSLTPLGTSLDKTKPIGVFNEHRPVEVLPLGIEARDKVSASLETGVSVVDMMIPLGKGQRQLIIGDRKTGKTNFLLQTILNQARKGTICIYCAIGKKKTDIRHVQIFFEKNGLLDETIIIASSSTDSAGVIYVTPYAAMSIAEYFRDQGRDVLIVLDDLSTHAKFYREISLLGKNFPGRNSYPGDIFYTHGRLIERAGNFKTPNGVVSITCLPVAETVEGDISGYIQTNLMSMTDGHIFFDKDLFAKGRRPAVNIFLSVTRVGRQTQTVVRSGINRELNSFLSLHEKTQSFVHFGAELSEGTKTTITLGDKVLDFFNQAPDRILDTNLQIMLFCLIWIGTWNKLSKEQARIELEKIITVYKREQSVRDLFKTYIDSAPDFNSLLGRLSSEVSVLQKTLESAFISSVSKTTMPKTGGTLGIGNDAIMPNSDRDINLIPGMEDK